MYFFLTNPVPSIYAPMGPNLFLNMLDSLFEGILAVYIPGDAFITFSIRDFPCGILGVVTSR